jgi:hypothetical protein
MNLLTKNQTASLSQPADVGLTSQSYNDGYSACVKAVARYAHWLKDREKVLAAWECDLTLREAKLSRLERSQ